ncbi:hypothetical protein HY992_02885 [Candidatus Micrarchaeota archaeon]|nr:hypothetical protein [Candidatus Micrarchaeota archaeon]
MGTIEIKIKETRIKGKITRATELREGYKLLVLTEKGLVETVTQEKFEAGEIVELSGTLQLDGFMRASEEPKKLEGKEAEEERKKVEEALEQKAKTLETKPLINDGTMNEIMESVEKAAFELKKAALEGKPILMRYHGDADGIAGGIMLRKALGKIVWDARNSFWSFQNDSAVYKNKHALKDISWLSGLYYEHEQPVVLLVDFAANPESADALKLIKKAGFKVIVIDHHPPGEQTRQTVDVLAAPWNTKTQNPAQYTAGLLAGETAKKITEINVEQLQKISLAGDKSKLVEPSEEAKKNSTALDFLATYSKFSNSLEFYEKILADEKMLESIYQQAKHQIETMTAAAREHTKTRKLENGFTIALVKLDAAAKKGEFPSKGKATGRVHDEIEMQVKGPLVTIGYGSKAINMRANKQALEAGFDANKIIQQMKEELKGAMEAGGGHAAASGIRLNAGYGKIVLEELVKKIEQIKID